MSTRPSQGLRTILVATDFSPAAETAVERAADLAAAYGARLALVHAVAWSDDLDTGSEQADAAMLVLRQAAAARLEAAASPLRGRGLDPVTRVAVGPSSQVIIGAARELDADLVVVGTRGLTGWRHVLLGSTAQLVLEGAACPVLAVHRGDPVRALRPRRVLVATDFSADASAALRWADELLGLAAGAVVLLHAYQPPPLLTGPSVGPVAAGREAGDGYRERAAWRLAQEAEALRVGGRRPGIEVREGYPADAIVAAARDLDADLVVVASRGRSGLVHLLLGSTAERVVQHAGCPVLVVPAVPRPQATAAARPELVTAG